MGIEKRENYEKRKHEKEIEKQKKEDEMLIEKQRKEDENERAKLMKQRSDQAKKEKKYEKKKARDASREQRILLYSQVILQLADGFRDTSFGQFFVRSVEGFRNRLLAEHKNWSF